MIACRLIILNICMDIPWVLFINIKTVFDRRESTFKRQCMLHEHRSGLKKASNLYVTVLGKTSNFAD